MNLALQLLHRINEHGNSRSEQAVLRCALARELEDAGNFEAAQDALGELWERLGEQPKLDGLNKTASAEVLLRAGTLTGWIGSARQLSGAQEAAKDLISRSLFIFDSLKENAKASEAQIELAWCYWREGAFDEARVTFKEAVQRLSEADSELKAIAYIRHAEVERSATRLNDALQILNEIAPLVKASANHSLKGKFYNTLAHTLEALGDAENRQDYTDRALIESAAASFHFEQAGHTPHYASVENNLGFLLYRAGRHSDAHEHLDRARRLFLSLKDVGRVAQVDETRARTLLAQGRNSEAERVIRGAVQTLKKGGERALLAEALTTHGVALARLGRQEQAETELEEAIAVARLGGDPQGAGRAALTIIEELGQQLPFEKLQLAYEQADTLLASTQHLETIRRLREAARRIIAGKAKAQEHRGAETPFLYASETTAELVNFVQCVAGTDRPLLLMGETGTGKEVLARLAHQWSGRAGRFVAINCATLSEALLQTQLFGHRKGSFTDAVENHAGAAREAEGGTLFLDEVGELTAANQAKLLRLIESGEIYSIGSSFPEHVNVRIVAATNRDLRRDVENGRFRADLYYRLSTFLVEIPPLRERPEDIPVIARHFIDRATQQYQKRINFTPESLEAMRHLVLKGNARELRTLIERTFLTAENGTEVTGSAVRTLSLRQRQTACFADVWAGCALDEEVRLYEGSLIRLALEASRGRLTQAARLLGITHQGLSFILNGRQKELLAARKPVQRRRSSLFRKQK